MLIDINLLPQKERKKSTFVALLGTLTAIILAVGGIYLYQIETTKSDLQIINGQIASDQKLLDKLAQNGNQANQESSVTQLKAAVAWAQSYPIQTVPVMKELTSFLPERGFIQSFTYNESGTATISVQFDTSVDAAYFLNNLENSNWVADASLTSLSTSTAATGTTNAAAVHPQNTPGSVPNTQSNPTNQAGSGTAAQGSGTLPAGITSSPPSSAAAPVSGGTSTGNSSSDSYLPRYIGQFELKFNTDYIKRTISKSAADGEGVAGK